MGVKVVYPKWPDNVGKRGKSVFPDKSIRRYRIADEIRREQTGSTNKVIYLQRIEFEDGEIQLRLCYYTIGKLPKMKGKWVFGQFATFLPAKDFKAIVTEARRKEWI
jgi:hypothetical protein